MDLLMWFNKLVRISYEHHIIISFVSAHARISFLLYTSCMCKISAGKNDKHTTYRFRQELSPFALDFLRAHALMLLHASS